MINKSRNDMSDLRELVGSESDGKLLESNDVRFFSFINHRLISLNSSIYMV